MLLRGRDFDLSIGDDSWDWRGIAQGEQIELRGLPLLDLPMQNAALALQAFALLGYILQPDATGKVLAETRLAGRLDRRFVKWHGKSLNLLLDVGHNPTPPGFWGNAWRGSHLAASVLQCLACSVTRISTVWSRTWRRSLKSGPLRRFRPRAAGRQKSCRRPCRTFGARVTSYQSIALALEAQCAHATPDDEILLFGSFYCVAEALEWLARYTDEDAANGFAG